MWNKTARAFAPLSRGLVIITLCAGLGAAAVSILADAWFSVLPVVVAFREFRNYLRARTFDMLTVVGGALILCYSIVPMAAPVLWAQTHPWTGSGFRIATISVLAYCVCVFGYYSKRQWKRKGGHEVRQGVDFVTQRLYTRAGTGLLVMGLLSAGVYVWLAGGLSEAIEAAPGLRSGTSIQPVAASPFAFVRNTMAIAYPAVWILAGVTITRWEQRKNWHAARRIRSLLPLLGLVATGSFVSLMTPLLRASRSDFILFLVPLILAVVRASRPSRKAFLAALLGLVLAGWLLLAPVLFARVSYAPEARADFGGREGTSRILTEFAHPYQSLEHVIHRGVNQELQFFSDVWAGVVNLLPSRLLGLQPPTSITELNTEALTGTSASIIPPGLLAYGMYAGGLAGVIVVSYLFGLLASAVDGLLKPRMSQSFAWASLYMAVAMATVGVVMSGDPRVIFKRYFFLFVALVVMFGVQGFAKRTARRSHFAEVLE